MNRYLRLVCGASLASLLVALVSCGSRTGLFGPESGLFPDGGSPDAAIDAGEDGAVPCVPGKFGLERATAQLMFVIDRSGSMLFTLDGKPEPEPWEQSRWSVLRDALSTTLVPFDGEIAMGAKFFPRVLTGPDVGDPIKACSSEDGAGLQPQLGNVPSILKVFDTTTPRGGTPTSEALRLAADGLVQRRAVARTIVLATDGAPNCNEDLEPAICQCTLPPEQCDGDISPSNCLDDKRTLDTIRNIYERQKVPVYVIGLGADRADFARVLDDMAVAGGRPRVTRPRHYSVQTPADLTNALSTIRDSVATCTYLTPSVPQDPNAITVEIGGIFIRRDPTRTEGWDWVDQAYGAIAFFGSACEKLQGGAGATGVVSCDP